VSNEIFFTGFLLPADSCSVWFDSARVGLIVGFVAWFANFFPILFLQSRFNTLSL